MNVGDFVLRTLAQDNILILKHVGSMWLITIFFASFKIENFNFNQIILIRNNEYKEEYT